MKTKFFLTILFLQILAVGYGQLAVFSLVHNGNSAFFQSLDTAMQMAQAGDTLYIPGGTFSGLTIDKGIHVYGTGYHPDSTSATFSTYFTNVHIIEGANGGSVQGIACNALNFGNNPNNSNVISFMVKRCKVDNSIDLCAAGTISAAQSITFSEVITPVFLLKNAQNIIIRKSIFGYFDGAHYATFQNNIIYTPVLWYMYNCGYYSPILGVGDFCIFQNNIIGGFSCGNVENSMFANNVFEYGMSNGQFGSNVGTGNLLVNSLSDVFVNSAGTEFSFSQNYHLAPNAVGTAAGTDGTDVGIYGTAVPFKDGGLPDNPHIAFKNIGFQTGANGLLHVEIKVTAQ